jgi:hypothetical protein
MIGSRREHSVWKANKCGKWIASSSGLTRFLSLFLSFMCVCVYERERGGREKKSVCVRSSTVFEKIVDRNAMDDVLWCTTLTQSKVFEWY